jgi:hypothetical protein
MIWLYERLINIILWLIKAITPEQGPTLSTTDKWNPTNKNHNQQDTGYGFYIDYWPTSVKILDYILSKIPIFDIEPTIDPILATEYLDKTYGDRVPEESKNYNSLTEFIVQNTGSYFLKLESGCDCNYILDLSDYEQYEVRENTEKYGGKVFIRNNQIVCFEYLGQKYLANDQRIDRIIRATLCLHIMVTTHALRIHLCTSQRKTFEYMNKYPANHLMADFLYLSTYAAFDVNRRIPVLVGDHGLVVRLFSLKQSSYRQLVRNTLAQRAFIREEILGEPGTIWNKDITKYAKLVDELVYGLGKGMPKEELEDLSNFFLTASALHNQCGDSQTYAMTISHFLLPKVYIDKPNLISKMDQDLLIALLYSVTPRYPLIIDEDTAKVFADPEQRKLWENFQQKIVQQYTTPSYFSPLNFEISVGF